MMLATPVIAYALGIAVPAQARVWSFAWVTVVGLVVVVIFLAMLDMLNTWRLSVGEHRTIAADVLAKLPRTGTQAPLVSGAPPENPGA